MLVIQEKKKVKSTFDIIRANTVEQIDLDPSSINIPREKKLYGRETSESKKTLEFDSDQEGKNEKEMYTNEPEPAIRRRKSIKSLTLAISAELALKKIESDKSDAKRVERIYDPEFDLSLSTFPIRDFKFLLFGKTILNEKEFKKFILEVADDVNIIKSIKHKEAPPSKVVLVGLNKSNWLLT